MASQRLLCAIAFLVGAVSIIVPTMINVAEIGWTREDASHGPIVLLTGLWLLWRKWPEAVRNIDRPRTRNVTLALAFSLMLYALSRVTQIIEIEGYAMYLVLIAAVYSLIGFSNLRKIWFPLLYLAFAFPPPETIVAAITLPLKMHLSAASVWLLNIMGYPVALQGVEIYIGQYQLLVAAACAGLNSIITLSAITMFYIYIFHAKDMAFSAILMLFILPLALLANFLRVIFLILITYHLGESAAQGFLHNFAGIFLFATVMVLIFWIDRLLSAARGNKNPIELSI